jgi:hypothetical protein
MDNVNISCISLDSQFVEISALLSFVGTQDAALVNVDSGFSLKGLQATGMSWKAINAVGKYWSAVAKIIEDTRMRKRVISNVLTNQTHS